MAYVPEPQYRHGTPPRTGVLLVNLGTPDEPTAPALRRYLKEFLSDPRVVEIPRRVWWLILNGVILNVRPKKSAAKYAAIWTPEGSPLKVHTERQTELLRGVLAGRAQPAPQVEYAMRYGSPPVAEALARLREGGCDRVLVLPLYPQYSASTTASVYDAVFGAIEAMRNVPELRLVKHYHDDPRYIAALAANVRAFWAASGRGQVLLMSFHGVPRFALDKGDPYHCECQKTGRLLAEALELAPAQYRVCFQSRFGGAEWLKPYTADTLAELPGRGVERVDVVCPGFVADCLETLEEIAMEGRQTFLGAGGKAFQYIPALNERPEWIAALAEVAADHLHGWIGAAPDAAALAGSRERALALGAPA